MWALNRGLVAGRAALDGAAVAVLPTGNLTFHADASVNTDLWTTDTAGSFSVHPTDGQAVNYWDDVEHADIVAGIETAAPLWQSGTPLMTLPCLSFNGSTQRLRLYANDGSTAKVLSDVITNSAFTAFASIYVAAVATTGADSVAYNNEAILSDTLGEWGIHLRNNSSVYSIQCYNDDGSANDTVSLTISLNTRYVIMFRHESGNLYASLNGGSESTVASGNTAALTGGVRIGRSSNATFYNGRVGEVAIYNAALTGSNLSAALSYFTTKWA